MKFMAAAAQRDIQGTTNSSQEATPSKNCEHFPNELDCAIRVHEERIPSNRAKESAR